MLWVARKTPRRRGTPHLPRLRPRRNGARPAGKDFLPSYLEHNSHLLTNRRRCRLRSTPRLTSDVEQGHGLEGPVGAGRIHHHPAARFITCQHLGSAGKAMGSLRRETSLHFSLKKKDKLGLCSWRELAGSWRQPARSPPIGRKLQLKMTLKKLQRERAFCLAVSVHGKPGRLPALRRRRSSGTFGQRPTSQGAEPGPHPRPDCKQGHQKKWGCVCVHENSEFQHFPHRYPKVKADGVVSLPDHFLFSVLIALTSITLSVVAIQLFFCFVFGFCFVFCI